MKPLSITGIFACIVCTIVAQHTRPKNSSKSSVKILPRSTWAKKDRISSKFKKHSGAINQIILHHSGASIHLDGDPRKRINNSIRSWHMEVKGKWGDVAYHYILDKEGNIYEGRPQEVKGKSFTKYNLDRKLLICVLGDYRTLEEKTSDLEMILRRKLKQNEITKLKSEFKKYGNTLSEKTQNSIVNLVSAKAKELGLDINDIKTHREIAKSSCPGINYQGWLDTKGKKQIAAQIKR